LFLEHREFALEHGRSRLVIEVVLFGGLGCFSLQLFTERRYLGLESQYFGIRLVAGMAKLSPQHSMLSYQLVVLVRQLAALSLLLLASCLEVLKGLRGREPSSLQMVPFRRDPLELS